MLGYNENEMLILLYNLLLYYITFHSIYRNSNYGKISWKNIYLYSWSKDGHMYSFDMVLKIYIQSVIEPSIT